MRPAVALLLVTGCSQAVEVDKISARIEVDHEYISAVAFIDEPCGCVIEPVRLGQCVQGTDACNQNCESCIESLSIVVGGEHHAAERSRGYDLQLGLDHGLLPGAQLAVLVSGCGQEFSTPVEIPNRIAIQANATQFHDGQVHFDWTPSGATAVQISAHYGFVSDVCWTDDDGGESMDAIQDPLGTSVMQLYLVSSVDSEEKRVDVFRTSDAFVGP